MRFLKASETAGPSAGETVFNKSVLIASLPFAVSTLVTLGAAGWYASELLDGEATLQTHLIGGWAIFWAGLLAAVFRAQAVAARRSSNWLIRLSPGTILVKYRSNLNDHLPAEDPVVIELRTSEVAWVRKARETSVSELLSGESQAETITYVDFKLAIPEAKAALIASALSAERNRKPHGSGLFDLRKKLFETRKRKAPPEEIDALAATLRQEEILAGKTWGSYVRTLEYPVQWIAPGILRVTWRGISHSAKAALEIFRTQLVIESDLIFKSTSDVVSVEECDNRILDFVAKGQKLQAIALARRFHGMSLAEAKQFVEDLETAPGAGQQATPLHE